MTLHDEIQQAKQEVQRAEVSYALALPDYEIAAWHQLQAAEARLRALLREAREGAA